MEKDSIKKITSVSDLEKVAADIHQLHLEDNLQYGHAFNLKHDVELMLKSFSHESILLWNGHLWAHFNGEKWDGIFGGIIRKSEKFNKKIMEEYLWLAKSSNAGMRLYKTAVDFAKNQKCEFIFMNVAENHPYSEKIKKIYKILGFTKDTETYVKNL